MNNIVVGIGELLWDIFENHKVVGGAPSNFAFHAAQFGLAAYTVSAIGKDDLGAELLNFLESKPLIKEIATLDYPTGTVNVRLNTHGIPSYTIAQDVAWDHIPFDNQKLKLAQHTQAVCFGTLAQRHADSRETIHQFLRAMPARSLRIFDVNLRLHFYTKQIIWASLLAANVLKINDEELIILSGLYGWVGSKTEICNALFGIFPTFKVVILTCGAEGSYIFTPEAASFLATPKVVVADTVGAGDAFTAAFVVGYLRGNSVQLSHELAVKISAFVCTQHGAMPKLPMSVLE